ncbi:MAG: V-type ATP synthase subunit F [Syntrophales bacterium]|jgi:vacuolar-type H+-ATPase subunit F/Vma7|nr:V-type ATP synthase subunit F [Syntrophales bacterium]MCK9527738.1 V-type ATP synthase subunit F [Syntrophales bacterium]MDX9921607.1 V-type ATP synthase subunit F [Syntrophales bacterium]
MRILQDLEIAIIGTDDQTSLMRLAGVGKYCRVEEDSGVDLREKIRIGFETFLQDRSVGIIMIPDDWTVHVADMLVRMRQARGVPKKAVIEYPPGLRTEPMDVKSFYKNYTKNLIGFNVEI